MMLQLDRSIGDGLQTQLLDQLRQLIASGRIAPLSRMPATRNLARQLGISRTTVMLVYEELIAEGYLQTKPAAGTFVSSRPPGAAVSRLTRLGRETDRRSAHPSPLPVAARVAGTERPRFDFRSGGFDHRLFPAKTWQRLVSRALRDGASDLSDDHPAGSERLRAAVAGWMMAERGIPAQPQEVVIVSGIRQACYILSRLLLDPESLAWVDGQLPRSVAWIFRSLDIDSRQLPGNSVPSPESGRNKLSWFNTPHPHALGSSNGDWQARRSSLLGWVEQTDGYLVEYEGLDHILFLAPPANGISSDRTVRLGEFSPTLGLGTRMGYMIVPPSLIDRVTSFKESLGGAPPLLEQAVLVRFIEDGGYSRHLRRVGKVMTERRAALMAALRCNFAAAMLDEPTAEDHLTCCLPDGLPSAELIRDRARTSGLALDAPERRSSEDRLNAEQVLWLSYARMNEQQINAAIGQLAAIVRGATTRRVDGLGALGERTLQHSAANR